MAGKPKLLDQVRTAIRTRHLSMRTEEAYVRWIRKFILHHGKRHPSELGAAEIGAYFSYLATERQVAASTQNQALNALFFLYCRVLETPFPELDHLVLARSRAGFPSFSPVRRLAAGPASASIVRWTRPDRNRAHPALAAVPRIVAAAPVTVRSRDRRR